MATTANGAGATGQDAERRFYGRMALAIIIDHFHRICAQLLSVPDGQLSKAQSCR
jgi:hypothetical protein